MAGHCSLSGGVPTHPDLGFLVQARYQVGHGVLGSRGRLPLGGRSLVARHCEQGDDGGEDGGGRPMVRSLWVSMFLSSFDVWFLHHNRGEALPVCASASLREGPSGENGLPASAASAPVFGAAGMEDSVAEGVTGDFREGLDLRLCSLLVGVWVKGIRQG